MRRIGIISDTHGLLRPEAVAALAGYDLILHAGDIGSPDVLEALSRIAPLTAVRGNNDRGAWARAVPETEVVEVDGLRLLLMHNVKELDRDPFSAGFAAVVSGHSHVPGFNVEKGVLFFNPGSAGPRRFRLPVALGSIIVQHGRLLPAIVELAV